MQLSFKFNDAELTANEFAELFGKVWRHKLDLSEVQSALQRTINITARHENRLVGCVRVITDGYFFGAITELIVHPDYRSQNVGEQLLQNAAEQYSGNLLFAVHPVDEETMRDLGWQKGYQSYVRKQSQF
jgi:ribosomal protein S18 acetylase RimI-like enzyme